MEGSRDNELANEYEDFGSDQSDNTFCSPDCEASVLLTDAIAKAIEKDGEYLSLKIYHWEREMRDNAYIFRATMGSRNTRTVIGMVFNACEERNRGELILQMVIDCKWPTFLKYIVEFPLKFAIKSKMNSVGDPDGYSDTENVKLEFTVVLIEDNGCSLTDFVGKAHEIGVARSFRQIYLQLFQALSILHDKGYILGDIRPNFINVLKYRSRPINPDSSVDVHTSFADFTQLTQSASRTCDVLPWGMKQGLCRKGSSSSSSVDDEGSCFSDYQRADEIEISANLFQFFKKYMENGVILFPALQQAASVLEKEMIRRDRHISSHFLNMYESFRCNIIYGLSKPQPNTMNICNATQHCFFFTPEETLSMIEAFSYDMLFHESEVLDDLKNRTKNVFTETNWLCRLGPTLSAYVKEQRLLKKRYLEVYEVEDAPAAEEDTASNKSKIYTNYDTCLLKFLLVLMRNLYQHRNLSVMKEIFEGSKFNTERFLQYFTIRFPGLIVTIYELCAKYKIGGIANVNLILLKQSATDPPAVVRIDGEKISPPSLEAEEGVVLTSNEYVSCVQVLHAELQAKAKNVNMDFQ